jgi:hypothetical protein
LPQWLQQFNALVRVELIAVKKSLNACIGCKRSIAMMKERVQVMGEESVKAIRDLPILQRRVVLLACLATGLGLLVNQESGTPRSLAGEMTAGTTASPLLAEAITFVHDIFQRQGDIMMSPVSRLQRQFRLSYRRGCELAGQLETAGVWTVFRDHEGARVARVLPPPALFGLV